MKTRTLGRHGLQVSAIGLGMGSTTTNFGEADGQVQVATMRRALDLGVNFLDSSDAYQKGRHEQLIAEAIRGRREGVVVVSKVGNRPYRLKVRSACLSNLQALKHMSVGQYVADAIIVLGSIDIVLSEVDR